MRREPIFWDSPLGAIEAALDGARRELRRYWAGHLALMPIRHLDATSTRQRIVDADEDRVCHAILRDALSACGFPLVAEDVDCGDEKIDLPGFLLDPLDGTHNALMGYPAYTSSVALYDAHGSVSFGWVYDLSRDMLYIAGAGLGSYVQSPVALRRLRTHARERLDDLAVSIMRRRDEDQQLSRLIRSARKVRVSACSSLDLCLIATGALDAFVDINVPGHQRTCDIAAAALVLCEAGGATLTVTGTERRLALPSREALADYGGLIAVGDSRCGVLLASLWQSERQHVSG